MLKRALLRAPDVKRVLEFLDKDLKRISMGALITQIVIIDISSITLQEEPLTFHDTFHFDIIDIIARTSVRFYIAFADVYS